jgi:hypothetical protein
VIYLTPGDDVGAALQQAHAPQPGWMFSLLVVRLWELDAAEALRSGNLALMVLSPLLGHASAALIEQAIHQVQNQATPEQQAELLTILAVFTEPWIDQERLIELVGRERLMASNLIQTLVEEQVAERVAERVATLTQERYTLRHALQQAVEDAIIGRFPTTPAILVRDLRHVTDVDRFFSAVDQNTIIGDATLAAIKAHPEQYALVDVQVTTIYGRVTLLARDDTDAAGESDVVLTA